MAGALWILTAAVVVLIAVGAIGAVTARLATEVRISVYDLAEAVEFVAERLPHDASARLSYEEVQAILEIHLDLLEGDGVAVEDGDEVLTEGPALVVDEDASVARVLVALDDRLEVTDEDVALVLAYEADYVRAIGAIGAAAPAPPPDAS